MKIEEDIQFTIIIVNWNGYSFLPACLDSIARSRGIEKVQTIVVDNASTDNSVALLQDRYPWVNLICSDRNLGFAAANNLALKEATGELVMFLNPDVSLREGTLERLYKFMQENQQVGAVGCKILSPEGDVQPLMVQNFPTPFLEFRKLFNLKNMAGKLIGLSLPQKDPFTSGEALKLSGACLTVRKTVLEKIGGFDERFFMYCEDGDLCLNIIEAGWKLYYLAEAEVTHIQGACSRKAPKGFPVLMQCESFEKLMEKRFGKGGAVRYRIYMFVGSAIRLIISIISYTMCIFLFKSFKEKWQKRIYKNWLMLRWSIFLAKPQVPK